MGEHIFEIENGKPRVLESVWSIFNATYERAPGGCVVRDVSVDTSSESV